MHTRTPFNDFSSPAEIHQIPAQKNENSNRVSQINNDKAPGIVKITRPKKKGSRPLSPLQMEYKKVMAELIPMLIPTLVKEGVLQVARVESVTPVIRPHNVPAASSENCGETLQGTERTDDGLMTVADRVNSDGASKGNEAGTSVTSQKPNSK